MPFDDWFRLVRRDERHPFELNRDQATGRNGRVLLETMNGLGIAQFYSPDGPRTLRRGDRPYSSTVKLPEGEAPSPRGYQLQLEGKISGFADGQPVHCFQQDASVAPRCLIAVQFERVAFVAPDKPEPIVEWH